MTNWTIFSSFTGVWTWDPWSAMLLHRPLDYDAPPFNCRITTRQWKVFVYPYQEPAYSLWWLQFILLMSRSCSSDIGYVVSPWAIRAINWSLAIVSVWSRKTKKEKKKWNRSHWNSIEAKVHQFQNSFLKDTTCIKNKKLKN